ncbi:protein FAM221A isoform X2 [Amia ocellicauda]|uniref:protein FAM221A isoform X2 n=1 Tax=Amia ocellicauda TaxID=2972642 RepID=UPI0034644E13|nr:F221A protein [Amia calva]
MERIRINADAAAAVEKYLEYRRIVGEDDGGQLFTPEEYEEYKNKVLPQRMQNRLYVSWGVPGGIDCKLIGPETPCFCTHRYKQHKTDFKQIPEGRPLLLPCKVKGCRCESYHYVPLNGSQPVRCRCKHFPDEHSEAGGFVCKRCSTCVGFHSPYTCGCRQPSFSHETLVETKEERQARGRPVGKDVPYAAMGGLTGFSSLAEGYMRLDDSGVGAPPRDVLESAGTAMDHTVVKTYEGRQLQPGFDVNSVATQMSRVKTSEEEDMAYFERRYQERLKNEKMAKHQKGASSSRAKPPSGTSPQTQK